MDRERSYLAWGPVQFASESDILESPLYITTCVARAFNLR